MDIINHLKANGVENEMILGWFKENSKTRTYPKGHILLSPEETSHRVFFVEKGLVRALYSKGDKDITQTFLLKTLS